MLVNEHDISVQCVKFMLFYYQHAMIKRIQFDFSHFTKIIKYFYSLLVSQIGARMEFKETNLVIKFEEMET